MAAEQTTEVFFRAIEFCNNPDEVAHVLQERAAEYLAKETIYEIWWSAEYQPLRKWCFLKSLAGDANLPLEVATKQKYVPEKGPWFIGRYKVT